MKPIATLLLILAAAAPLPAAQECDALLLPSAAGAIERAHHYMAMPLMQGALDALTALPPDAAAPEAWMEAEALFRAGRTADARMAYRILLQAAPAGDRAALAQLRIAECMLGAGDYSGAEAMLGQIQPSYLGSALRAERAYAQALCLMARGDHQAAAARLAEAAAPGSPLRSASNFFLGVLAYNSKDYPAATAYMSRTDATAEPGVRRDVYLAAMEANPAKALASARRALAVPGLSASEKATALFAAAQAEWHLGDRDAAAGYLERYMAQGVTPQPAAYYMLGLAALDRADYDRAAEMLSLASDAPGATGQHAAAMLGQALKARGSIDAAAVAFLRASEGDDPDLARQAFFNYATTRFGGANVPFASSSAAFEEFLRRYPTGLYSDRVREYLAQGYLADEDYGRAIERLEAMQNPSERSRAALRHVLYLAGTRCINSGDTARADRLLSKAAAIPGDRALTAEISLERARLSLARGRCADAHTALALYADRRGAPNAAAALYYDGYALLGMGKPDMADHAFARAAASGVFAGRELADILNRRADIASAASHFDSALSLYAQAQQADAATADYAIFSQARVMGFMRDYRGQLRKIDELRAQFPASALMPDALLDRAAAQVASEQPFEALDTYDTLIRDYPLTNQGRKAYIQKAMTLLECHRQDEAVETYKQIMRLYPTSAEAGHASDLLRAYMADHDRGAEYLDFVRSLGTPPAIDPAEAAALAFGTARRRFADHSDYTALEQFLAEYPDSREAEQATAMLAQADFDAGRTERSLQRWQALEQRASSADMASQARMGILRAARDLGDTAMAAEAAAAVLESSAASPADMAEATFSRALFLSQDSAQVPEAVRLWLSVASDADQLYGAKSAYAAAEALFAAGEADRALEVAKALAASRSPHQYWVARAFILQADILTAKGQQYQAREYLRALRDNYPGSEPDIMDAIASRLQPENQ